jgi:hypothetical protein
MSTRSRKIMFLGSKARLVHRAENITTTCELTVYRQCGILNISQPYRPPSSVTGIAILYFLSHAVHEYEGIHIISYTITQIRIQACIHKGLIRKYFYFQEHSLSLGLREEKQSSTIK